MEEQTASRAEAATALRPPHLQPAGLERVLVGFDERPASRDALALAGALCRSTGAELLVASVRPYWPDLLGPDDYARVVEEDEAWLQREAAKQLGRQPFSTRVIAGGHETGGLKELASAEGADLIAVGSTHRGRLGRVLPGSVGERVLNNAPCAVAIAPLGLADHGFQLRRIVTGFDGSRESSVALALAAALAEQAGASLSILGVVEPQFDLAGLEKGPDELEQSRLHRQLERAVQLVPTGVETETELRHGRAAAALAEAAEQADLLVLGSRGHYGPATRLFLGSVAARVIRDAPCATLLTAAP